MFRARGRPQFGDPESLCRKADSMVVSEKISLIENETTRKFIVLSAEIILVASAADEVGSFSSQRCPVL